MHATASGSAIHVSERHVRRSAYAWFLGALLPACSAFAFSPAVNQLDGEVPLRHWAEQIAGPHLREKIGEHPRLRGRPVQVVVMRGDQRPAHSNALALELQRRMVEILAETPGARLVPERPPGVDTASCFESSGVEYRIAVDVEGLGQHRARVQFRVFDVVESTWVGGIGGRWQGTLDGEERRLLARRTPIEAALGQRGHPFRADQTDLLADALTLELMCALGRPAAGRGEAANARRVFLAPEAALPPELQKAGLLIVHAIAREHGLEHVYDSPRADVSLHLHAHSVDAHQALFWVTLEGRGAGGRSGLPDVISDATPGGRVLAVARAYIAGPALAAAESTPPGWSDPMSSEPANTTRSGTTRPAQSLRQASAELDSKASAAWGPSAPAPAPAQALLGTPRLVEDASHDVCVADARRGGGVPLASQRPHRQRRGTCYLMELKVNASADVFVLWEPTRCRLRASPGFERDRVQRHRIGGVTNLRVVLPDLAGPDEFSSVYVIAVARGHDAAAIHDLLQGHPAGHGCDSSHWSRKLRRWALALEAGLGALGAAADWQALRVPGANL